MSRFITFFKETPKEQLATLILRLFIAVTFIFAGLQKLANPDFFNPKSQVSITAQLIAYSRNSPIGFLLKHLISHANLIGLLMALGELAVGVGMLFGLLTRIAAAGGMFISLNLFLSVSFNVSPYYTGSDIVFFFAFTPFVIGGAPIFSLDALIKRVSTKRLTKEARKGRSYRDQGRRVLIGSLFGVGSVVLFLAGATALIGRLFHKNSPASNVTIGINHASSSLVENSVNPQSSSTNAGSPGNSIGNISQVPVGNAATFNDPISGTPGYVFRPTPNKIVVFSAICPHAGCTVNAFPLKKLAVCPCHGSQFDLGTGQVLVGPAQSNLTPIKFQETSSGEIIILE